MSIRHRTTRALARIGLAGVTAAAVSAVAGVAMAQDHPWLDKTLLDAAKKESGTINVYSSTNEREGLPLWKIFTDATGIKVNYVRGSDNQLMARISIEQRAGRQEWDILQTTSLQKFPQSMMAQLDLSEARHLSADAKDKDRRWFGVYANYNTPGYNTKLVKESDLPRSYEEFLKHPEWKGKIAIDYSDNEWLAAMYKHYGDKRAEALIKDLVKTLQPAVTKGHLAMARSVGAGEYALQLNNYTNLILNVKLAGGPSDFFVLDPVAVFYGMVGANAKSNNPKSAALAANFAISKEAQTHLAKFGRIPTREDVATNPPGVLDKFKGRKIYTMLFTGKEDQIWQKKFKELFAQPR